MGLSGKPYQRSGGPFSRGGGGGGRGGNEGRGGRGGGRNGANNNDSRKAGRDRNGGGGGNNSNNNDRNNNNTNNNSNNNRNSNNNGGRGGGRGGGPRTQAGNDVIGTLLQLMFDRHAQTMYNPELGLLNLAMFKQSPDLASAQSAIDFNNVAFCKSLVAVIKASPIGVPRIIDVSGNDIGSPSNFLRALLDEGMNTIIGFNFGNNRIKDVGFAGLISRFHNLADLSVANNPITDPHYRRTLAKRLPSLSFIDGTSVERPPLSLPYPKPAAPTPDALSVLTFVNDALLNALVSNNAQMLMATYHPDAVLSCSSEENFAISCQILPTTDKCIREDFATLKHALKDCNADLNNRGGVSRIVKGRTQIMAALEKTLYHRKFLTHHELNPNATVSFLSTSAAVVPAAVVTIHGTMKWLPVAAQNETPREALFDRTLTLVSAAGGGWQVTNDIVHLRRARGEAPLFFANSPQRIDRLCKGFGSIYPPEIFAALVDISANDKEYYELRNGIPKAIMEQSYLATGGDSAKTVRAAKLSVMRQCTPQQAHEALEAVGYDMSRV